MDRTGIIVVSLCVVVLGIWFVAQNKLQMEQARYSATNQVARAQSQPTVTGSNVVAAPASMTVPTTSPIFDTNSLETLRVVTNGRARYTFTSRGGGLKSVELLDYPETVSPRWKKKVAKDGVATLNARAPLPVLAVLGDTNLVGDGNFTLAPMADAHGVRVEKSLANGLRLTKEFRLSSNYLVYASVRLENVSDQPCALAGQEWIIGTATPMGPDDTGFSMNEGVMWFDGTGVQDRLVGWFSGSGFGCFRGAPRSECLAGSNNVVWAAAHNQFFALMAMPKDPAPQIVARPVNLPPFPNIEPIPGAPLPQGVLAAFVYPMTTLAAHSAVERQVVFFAGPKEYRTLAEIGAEFQNHADNVMGFNGFFGFCAKPLLLMMNWLHDVTRLSYGWAIVAITILLRAIFWPFMARSIRSAKKMQVLAPELKILQDKYKDDPVKMMQKRSELLKKHNVSMMSGCLPMLIQMPVFFGFFMMLRSAIELRGAHFLWVADLSKPDTIFMIPGTSFPFNLLPLLMVGVMVWQAHLQPPSPGMDPAQQKLMRYFPLFMLLFLYFYSSGLALYMTVSTLLGVVQTMLTKNLRDPAAPAAPSALTPVSKKKK